MISKTRARTKAASLKASVDEVHAALDALPDGQEKNAANAAFDRLHAKLNGAAKLLADIFEDDIQTFSGGTDRPQED